MTEELYARRVEVSFVGAPPAHQVERASVVSEMPLPGHSRGTESRNHVDLRGHERRRRLRRLNSAGP